jgi:hypothetical protein
VKLCITGGPRTGKTWRADALLASELGRVLHTDHLIDATEDDNWSRSSTAAAQWLDLPDPYVIEGVAVARALRKWLAAHPDGRPCDMLIVLTVPVVPVTPRQAAMAKGVATVLREISGELLARGVHIRTEHAAADALAH